MPPATACSGRQRGGQGKRSSPWWSGLQRRHQQNYLDGIQKIRDGAVGEIRFIRTYFNMPGGGRAGEFKPAGMSEMEYQIRHWAVFCWLCGDHLVEQAIHEIDVANWVMDGHPVRANGMGGRQVRFGPATATSGTIMRWNSSMPAACGISARPGSSPAPGATSPRTSTARRACSPWASGRGGWARITPRSLRARSSAATIPTSGSTTTWWPASWAAGPYHFDGDYGATSSMTAVMGRMATYSGQVVTWEEATGSELALGPASFALDVEPPVLPDAAGAYAAAMPGVTKCW